MPTVDWLCQQLIMLIQTKVIRASSKNLLHALEEEILNEENSPLLNKTLSL